MRARQRWKPFLFGLFRKSCGASLVSRPGKVSAPRRLVHAAVVARRPGCGAPHPPAGVSGPSRPGVSQPWTAGPRVGRRSHTSAGLTCKVAASLPGRPRGGMKQPASRITEARAPGLREPGRSAVPPGDGGRRGVFEPCLGQTGGHGEFRSRATATRSAVEPTCLSRAPCRVAQFVGSPGTVMTTRYPHRIRKSRKRYWRVKRADRRPYSF